MTLADLRTLARSYVKSANTGTISNTVLDLILNAGIRDIAMYTLCLKTSKKITVTADDYDYDLSTVLTDYLGMDKPGVWWNAGDGTDTDWTQLYPRTLKYFDENSPDWRDEDSTDPLEYSIDGDILTLRPTPDTTLAEGLWIYYGATPTDMSDTTHYPFTGSTTEYTHLTIFDDAILAFWEWKAQKILAKGIEQEGMKEKEYLRVRAEKTALFNRRLDLSADKGAKLQGRKFRS